jgi:hypothetical protein
MPRRTVSVIGLSFVVSLGLLMPARETKHDVAECDPPFRAVVTQERLSWHFG